MGKKAPNKVGWKPNREQLAWAAGFIDGEGSFYTQQQDTRTVRPRFEIGQVHKDVLKRFQKIMPFGAKVLGPYENKIYPASKAKPMFIYYVSGYENVQALLALVWEWLGSVKRKQAIRTLRGAC